MSQSPPGRTETEEVRNAPAWKRFFFLRPLFGILLTASLVLGGLFAYTLLLKEALPDLDIPQATVTTTWPGADPRTMEEQVTDIIEDELTSLRGVRTINSASFDSYSLILVEFEASMDSVDAMTRLRASVADAEAHLPVDVDRPVIRQRSVDDRPIFTLVLHGDEGSAALNALGRSIRDRLERVAGVNEVDIGGEREDVVQILLRPERLLALSLSPTLIRNAVRQANIEQPFGEIRSDTIGAVVRLEGRFSDIDDLRALPVARLGDGASARAVRLDEVATVQRMQETETTRAFFRSADTEFLPSLEISVRKLPGADTVQVSESVLATLEEMRADGTWPDGIEYTVTQDSAKEIWNSLTEVFGSALQTMLIVFIILFVTISWREAAIAGLSVPVTFAGVLLVILFLGYSLNELVIIGMVIALVMIIDIFIILLEGLHDEIHLNDKTFGQAVLATIERYALPAFAAQITTILALVPLMSISGTVGEFIRVLPATTVICLVMSFIVAMLASLPLARYLLGRVRPPEQQAKQSYADRVTRRAVNALESWNARHVVSSRRHAAFWVVGALGLFMLSIFAFTQTRIELFPATDGERLGINIELPPTTQLATAQQVADQVGEILAAKPYFESTVMLVGRKSAFAGGSAAAALQPDEAENFIGYSAIFVERSERDADSYVLADRLRSEIGAFLADNVAGADLQVVPESGGPTQGDPIEIELFGHDLNMLQDLSRQVQNLLIATANVVDVRDNVGALKPQLALRPDREAADFFGIPHDELAGQIRIAFSSDIVGKFATTDDTDDIDILIGTEWPSHPGEAGGPRSTEEISLVRAYMPDGRTLAMYQLLQPVQSEGAIAISHRNGERAVTVMAKNQGRTVNEIISELTPQLEALQQDWPAGYRLVVGGESADTSETFGSAGIALVIAVVLVVGVLVILFNSFSQAFIIVTTMPLGLIGAFLGFFTFGLTFSFFAMIGVVSLIGIVVNNGIIMVDTMNRYLKEGMELAQAAAAGSARRLRPLITTSATTILGLIPLAIGSSSYRPLTLVIIFGLISATALALFVVPALYLLLTPERAGEEEILD